MTDEREGLPSASEAERIIKCPGYVASKAAMPKRLQTDSPDALEGTFLHEELEYEVDGKRLEFPDHEARRRYVMEHSTRIREELTTELIGENPKRLSEKRFWLTHQGKKLISAKADFVAINEEAGVWLFVDYKTGPGHYADATENWQIQTQIACAADSGWQEIKIPLNVAYGAIVQPLRSMKPVIVKLEPQGIRAVQSLLKRHLNVSEFNGAPRIPGPWCVHCPVIHACVETQSTTPIFRERLGDIRSMTGRQIAEVYPMLSVVEKRISELRGYAKELLEANPEAIPGLQLKECSGGYEANDLKTLRVTVEPWINREQFAAHLKVTLGAVRSQWIDTYAKNNDITKKDAEQAWVDKVVPVLTPKKSIKKIYPKKT